MRICHSLEVAHVALNFESGSVCAPDADLRISVSTNLEDGLSEWGSAFLENPFPDVYLGSEEA